MRVQQHEATVLALEAHQVLNAIARLVRPAQVSHRLQQERAVNDPQPAIARGADLKRRQAILDFTRLVDVADGRVEQRLHSRVRDFQAVVRQGCAVPELLGLAEEGGALLKVKWLIRRVTPARYHKREGSLVMRGNRSLREAQDQAAPALFHGDDGGRAGYSGPDTDLHPATERIRYHGSSALDGQHRRD